MPIDASQPSRRAPEIVVVPYDASWTAAHAEEAERILRALPGIVLEVFHIGSTAVPGLCAKPIIDLGLEVDLARMDSEPNVMAGLGYEAYGEFGLPGRRFFRRFDESGAATHHAHAYQAGNRELDRHLAFRDYLRAHPEIALEYGELKQRLAERHPNDRVGYGEAKDPFIKEHQALAIAWAATHPTAGPSTR